MTLQQPTSERQPIILPPGGGRAYPMGRIAAIFKADGRETAERYSISEWWLEPHTKGPGPHAHDEDDIFVVLEGTMSILIGSEWTHAQPGAFVLIPGGIVHDFENRGAVRCGAVNISIPGGFEASMPSICAWFAEHPPGSTEA